MQTLEPPSLRKAAAGFTLPSILVVVAALLILAVGILLVVGIERNTSRAYSDRQRAELAAEAAVEDMRGIFKTEAGNDNFLILQSTLANPITANTQSAPHLFLTVPKVSGGGYSYRHVPLFSAATFPTSTTLTPPKIEDAVGNDTSKYVEFTALPYNDKVRVSWINIKDEKSRTVARYAYWVEDLQGRVDAGIAGNDKGTASAHTRAVWPFPAAGLNDDALPAKPDLDQIALYAVDPTATSDNQGSIGKNIFKNRAMLITPGSLLASAQISPPMDRLKAVSGTGKIGELSNETSRGVEEGLVAGLKPYQEQALVPFVDGIDTSVAGKAKLNLNKLLATGGDAAVTEMSDFIKKGLPKFDTRKGGFPDDYTKTLAANAIDYADNDGKSTLGTGFRGVDNYPLVSEFLMRFRWDNVLTKAGKKYVVIKVATWVELWNMSDKETLPGTMDVTHDTRYTFELGADPEGGKLADTSTLLPPGVVDIGGDKYYPPVSVPALKANEYRVIKAGEVTYQIYAGPSAVFIPSPLILGGETWGASGATYKVRWNGQIIDQARGGIHRNDSSLKYPTGDKQAVRLTVPCLSGKPSAAAFIDGMGDPRMSFYNSASQDANSYPSNYSPNRRNIRYGIYSGDTKKIYGRVMPSEWPDGGHNSTCTSTSGMTETDTQKDPDDAVFMNPVLAAPLAEDAPMRLSNSTSTPRFYSATELGRVYDPIMYKTVEASGSNDQWGDVTSNSPDSTMGGGNTLRIGRPEHPYFDVSSEPGKEAYRLLDLFHVGLARSANSADREGAVVDLTGHVNINTANRSALKAMAVGQLGMDPKIGKRISETHNITSTMAPPLGSGKLPESEVNTQAEQIADAIIYTRKTTPFASPSGLSEVRDTSNRLVFGNKDLLTNGAKFERSDSAVEEIFDRVYEASTVRSRNFRIWVIGQAVAPTTSTTVAPEVLAEVRKAYTVFADPGKRASNGDIDPTKTTMTILNENDF